MAPRWKYLPEFAAAGMIPILYFIFTYVGMDSSDAQVYSAAVGALFWALTLWWRGQTPPAQLQLLSWRARIVRAALILVIAFLIESATAELVLDIAQKSFEVAGVTPTDPERVRRILNLYFSIPLGLVLLFALGFVGARLLPVTYPERWLAAIVVVWYTLRLTLYALVATRLGASQGFNMPTLGPAILRTIPTMALSFAALYSGYFFGRRRYGSVP